MTQFYVDKSQCSSHQIFPGVTIFTTAGDNVMLSLVEFAPHAGNLRYAASLDAIIAAGTPSTSML